VGVDDAEEGDADAGGGGRLRHIRY
jgi:hypothetical protein